MKRLLPLATLLLSAAADAHECWLLPDRFAAAVGDEIAIAHVVDTGWPGETLPRDPRRVVRFAIVDDKGEQPIEGEPGADPEGTVALRTPRVAIAVYRSNPSRVSLEPKLFESYLLDEDPSRERRALGEPLVVARLRAGPLAPRRRLLRSCRDRRRRAVRCP